MAEIQMSEDAIKATQVLNRLAEELHRRREPVQRRLDYYRGKHKLCYASPEFRDYFANRFAGFADNWCAPVVAVPAERMNVLGIRLNEGSRAADKDLTQAWKAADCERGSSEAFVTMLASSRAYCLVWSDPEEDGVPRVTWERPDQAIVGYDSDTGRRSAALKLWADDTMEYATLYQPKTVWKFQRSKSATTGLTVSGLIVPSAGLVNASAWGGWEPRQGNDDVWPLPNPLGQVPMVEFRSQTLLDDDPVSDIDGVIAMQDAINLTWAYLMNALDYASLPQRIVLGADIPKVPVLNSDGRVIGQRPVELDTLNSERIMWVPGEHARVAQWSPADLAAYSNVIERGVEHVAAQTRTPPHYLIGKLANLSAEALTAAESGLVSKTGERIVYVDSSVREVYALMALVQDNAEKAKACRSGTVVWADIQFRALAQKVDALVKMRQIGFPLEWIAEQYGLEPTEVDRVMKMREKEAESDPMMQALNPKPTPGEMVEDEAEEPVPAQV
ncbi:phage portal protein [Planomonospora sp. ID67723]|uniref:phage portal protein n=1 Tax=Planomonospora sp. ID67723 TaxID=2738134 RepID=UPI0018C37F56|nr:phage portal protein [Planomonospora sp. ID67723]MBG0828545.1 phage portal protein [Planomonospora sp. ID67723]